MGAGAEPVAASRTVVQLRPVASALPMGFLGLAGGTFVLAGMQVHWISAEQSHPVAFVLLAFVFPLQSLASVFGFLCRDVAVATGMAVLSGTWLALGLITLTGPPGATSGAAGLLLLLAAVGLWVPVTAGGSGRLLVAAVIAVASVRFAATGVYELTGAEGWKHTAGVIGLVLAAVAVYAAFALAVEDQHRRTVLPTGRRAAGAGGLDGDWGHQTDRIVREAGVRRQL
ncbi:GPR1/FUN34/YaaH family transporter [Streptomyces carpaticus]|uniref:hypothetical protein n=1 Tax=Streptomyces carpaticus TaxID=285558 RepID=UPI002202DBC2|nr:GPR1/FUN34/YaaH family transporter [Streptomyces carpaticus]